VSVCLEQDRAARATHTRVDHTHKDGARWEFGCISRQQIGPGTDIKIGHRVEQVYYCHPRGFPGEYGMHLADIGVIETEISEKYDHRAK
jgi:hypothetical protein